MAANTLWGGAPGWQNEIAIWNLGIISILLALFKTKINFDVVIPGLTMLSSLFAMNHLEAALFGGLIGNWVGFSLNCAAVILAAVWLLQKRMRAE